MNSYEFLELVDLIADVHPFYVENIAKAIRDAGYIKQYKKKPKYKTGDTVYYIKSTFLQDGWHNIIRSDTIRRVNVNKTVHSYLLKHEKYTYSEPYLFATEKEAKSILDKGKETK